MWIFCLKLAGTGNAWASELVKSKFPWEYRGLGRLFKAAFGTESWAGLAEILKGDFFFLPPRIWLSLDSSSFSSIHCRGPLRDLWEIACRNWPKPVDLLGRLGEPLGFQLLGAGDGILQRWAALDLPLTEIPKEADSAWFAYGIVSDFARNPTPHNLTELLGVFFEKWEKFDPPEDIVPWQFARCIDAARNGTPVLDIIDAIEAHRLGTEHEWKQWADLSDGVRLTWLGVHREHICVERGFLGPAFRNATWLYSPSRGHIVDYFRALGNALPSLDPRSEIALKLMRLACFSLYNHAENWTEQILGSTWSFIRQCSKLNIEVPREFIAAVLGSELSIRAKLNLLTQVPLKFSASSPMHEWKSVLERIKRRIDVLSNLHSEEIERILVPLSYLPPIQLPYLLRSAAVQAWKSATGRELSIAGMALSLGNFQLANMTDSSEVALHALRMKNHRGHFLSELIDDLDSGSGELVEGVLLKLLELLPQDSSELRAKAFRALVNVSQRRPAESRLADPRLRELE